MNRNNVNSEGEKTMCYAASHEPVAVLILQHLRTAATATTVGEVVQCMERLDSILPADDGVKWFNLLYLLVTRAVYQRSAERKWIDQHWIEHLDVVFAKLYFDALTHWYTQPEKVPRAWVALFDARYRTGIQRVQFALAGMNAHINHDLPIALVQTCAALQQVPDRASLQYRDYEDVNDVLTLVEPDALRHLASGLVGTIVEDLGALGHVISMWCVATARDTAWTNAELGWHLREQPNMRQHILLILDRMTGFAGRGLLIPVS